MCFYRHGTLKSIHPRNGKSVLCREVLRSSGDYRCTNKRYAFNEMSLETDHVFTSNLFYKASVKSICMQINYNYTVRHVANILFKEGRIHSISVTCIIIVMAFRCFSFKIISDKTISTFKMPSQKQVDIYILVHPFISCSSNVIIVPYTDKWDLLDITWPYSLSHGWQYAYNNIIRSVVDPHHRPAGSWGSGNPPTPENSLKIG